MVKVRKLFEDSCCFESVVRTIFLDSAKAFGRNSKGEGLVDFRHIDTLLLEVCILAVVASRGKHGRTSAVRVFSTHL